MQKRDNLQFYLHLSLIIVNLLMMDIEQLQDILLSFAYKENDTKKAHEAFVIVYRTFSKTVFSVAKKKLKDLRIYDEEFMNTVVNNTFLKIYENPNLEFTVNANSSVISSFEAYLVTILKNEIYNVLRKEEIRVPLVLKADLPDGLFNDAQIETKNSESENTKLLNEVLNTMSERDRGILLALYNYHEEGKKTPSDVLDVLAATYGTSRVNIRKIKQRGEEKIKEFFSKQSQLKPLK